MRGTPGSSADKSLRRLFEEFLKARSSSNRVPFPAMFQVVNGDAVINAVHCARGFEKPLNQRNCEILFSDTCINQREITVHERAIDGVFRFWFEFDRAFSLANRVVF